MPILISTFSLSDPAGPPYDNSDPCSMCPHSMRILYNEASRFAGELLRPKSTIPSIDVGLWYQFREAAYYARVPWNAPKEIHDFVALCRAVFETVPFFKIKAYGRILLESAESVRPYINQHLSKTTHAYE